MINIGSILKNESDVRTFKLRIEDDDGIFDLVVSKPTPLQYAQWLQLLLGKCAKVGIDFDKMVVRPELVTAHLLSEFSKIARQLSELAIGWEGDVEDEFSKKKLKQYLDLFPMKSALLVMGFLTQYQQWKDDLRKNSGNISPISIVGGMTPVAAVA